MKDAVVFAGYFPDENSLLVAREFIDFFNNHFPDCDFYFGTNPSRLAGTFEFLVRSSGLNADFGVARNELIVDSDASAYQEGLRLLKRRSENYRYIYFFHSKGATNKNSHATRQVFMNFFKDRNRIEHFLSAPTVGSYSLFLAKGKTTYPDAFNGLYKFELPYFYSYNYFHTIYAALAKPILDFIDNCDKGFLNTNIGEWCDRWFFERDFIQVVWRTGLYPATETLVKWDGCADLTPEILSFDIEEHKKLIGKQHLK